MLTYCELFQFQHGAIGRRRPFASAANRRSVSIPAWCDWEGTAVLDGTAGHVSFNSSMVRLGVVHNQSQKAGAGLFQFQHGAIGRPAFQFEVFDVPGVSIPAWCDWELTNLEIGPIRVGVSIPAWCDWEIYRAELKRNSDDSFNSSMVRLGV